MSEGSRKSGWRFPLLVVVALLVEVVAFQVAGGAFRAEFGGHADEAAHYVTGLMVRDYVASGFPGPPLQYAENYYAHYTKVALGHWPPLFYAVQAAWTLVFSPSRVAVLLLMAVLTAAMAAGIYLSLRRECGEMIGAVVALLFVSLPWIQRFSQMVMTEIPLMLLCFGAALAYGIFLEKPSWRPAILFSALATLAMLTNGRGATLALLPPLAVLISRRWGVLRNPLFWFPVLPAALLCGPWHWLTLKWGLNWAGELSLQFARRIAVANLVQMGALCGVCLCALAVVGLWAKVVGPQRGQTPGKWAALTALALSVWVFHTFLKGVMEPRYLMIAIPPLVALAGGGIQWLAQRLRQAGVRAAWAMPGLLVATAAGYGLDQFHLVRKPSAGYPQLVRSLLSRLDLRNSVMLVAGSAAREGAFIAEVAMQERRPGHFVLRSSKALASSTWLGENYQMRFREPGAVADYLESIPVGVVAVDVGRDEPWRPHRQQLLEAILQRPDRWRPLDLPGRPRSDLNVYRLTGHEHRAAVPAPADLRPTLGRRLLGR